MLVQLEAAAMRRSPQARRALIRTWYQAMTLLDRRAIMRFMNYGYSDGALQAQPLALEDADAENRYAIQMYHQLAAAISLGGRNVLEVGSGRGGGAAYLAQTFAPRAYTGLDFSDRAVRFCHRFYQVPVLRFVPGDAEALPFPDESFDVVLNVESSHCYPSVERFFGEVARVLRPNGFFLFADHRSRGAVERLQTQLAANGMRVIEDESIAAGVLRALDLDQERKRHLITQHAPPFLRARMMRFAAMPGSPIYESLRSGALDYRRCVLVKLA